MYKIPLSTLTSSGRYASVLPNTPPILFRHTCHFCLIVYHVYGTCQSPLDHEGHRAPKVAYPTFNDSTPRSSIEKSVHLFEYSKMKLGGNGSLSQNLKTIVDSIRNHIDTGQTEHEGIEASGWRHGGVNFSDTVKSLENKIREELTAHGVHVRSHTLLIASRLIISIHRS